MNQATLKNASIVSAFFFEHTFLAREKPGLVPPDDDADADWKRDGQKSQIRNSREA